MENIKTTENVDERSVEQKEILTIIDEEQSKSYTIPEKLPMMLCNPGKEEREHTIKDFLSREQFLGTFPWSHSALRNDIIFSLSCPNSLITKSMIAEKILGFKFLRGDIEFKIMMNKQPFQSGILRVSFFPVESPNDSYNTQLDTFKQFSGLQGVDVNLQTDKPAHVVVPYVYPVPTWNLSEQDLQWATIQARVYQPLRSSTGTDQITVSVFARFVKSTIDISMPTSYVAPTTLRALKDHYNNLQVGAEELVSDGAHSLLSVLPATGSIAQIVDKIPVLSSIGKGVSNVVQTLRNFGFSKPATTQQPHIMRPMYGFGMNNDDIPDVSHQMALTRNNLLDPTMPLFGTNIDEMSIANIIRIPQYINTFSFNKSDIVNKLLYQVKIGPVSTFEESEANEGEGLWNVYTTNLGYLSNCFNLWRGSINLTFKFAKTQFHSGRLMIVWFNQQANIPATYNDNLVKNYAMLYDLKDNYELCINIPYIQNSPWLETSQSFRGDFGNRNFNGIVGVYVLNQLQVAGLASNGIDVGVEMSAGKDFEFSVPRTPTHQGWPIGTSSSLKLNAAISDTDFILSKTWVPGENDGEFRMTVNPFFAIEEITHTSTRYYFRDQGLSVKSDEHDFTPFDNLIVYVIYDSDGKVALDVTVQMGDTMFWHYVSPSFEPTSFVGDPPKVVLASLQFTQVAAPSFNDLQVGRDEAYEGEDGIPINSGPLCVAENYYNESTVGESIVSIRQLIKRFNPTSNFALISDSVTGKSYIALNPQTFYELVANNKGINQPYVSYFQPAFRFWRGGRRFKLAIDVDGEPLNRNVTIYYFPNTPFQDYASAADITRIRDLLDTDSSRIIIPSNREAIFEFAVPYYNKNPITIAGASYGSSDTEVLPSYVLIDIGKVATDASVDVKLYTSVQEDFMMGSLLSAPTLVYRVLT